MRRLIILIGILATACTLTRPTPTPISSTLSHRSAAALEGAIATPSPTSASTLIATPTVSPTDIRSALQEQVDAILVKYPGDWHILVKRLDGESLYARQTSQSIDVASVIKIPLALLFFKSLEPQHLSSLKTYLAEKGADERTFAQLMHAMIVDSEEDATFTLLKTVTNSGLNVSATLKDWGAPNTNIYWRKSTVSDMATLTEGLYDGKLATPEARDILLGYMAEYTDEDDTRTGVIRTQLPCGGHDYNKRGTVIDEYLVVADLAIIDFPTPGGQQAYLIALFAYPGKSDATYQSLVQGMEALAPIFWQAIRAESGLGETVACTHP